ncbi:DNA-directed RNA polymerase I subunit RPA2-like [Actinia tenebrosa]|uniref:DNA-directed RNA polymerase subunit beta n=1 Tax=Actinia tenebrosa TaxID=6105 RepID=A0A6P8HLS8_ACTTE|nr:DNA-directed RNA polymerase I subunit RPA2-like [Actinia tenebrosa]
MAAEEKEETAKPLPSLKKLSSKNYGRLSAEQEKSMQDLVRPHIESFNFMLEEGLSLAVQGIPPSELMTAGGQRVSVYFTDASIGVPTISDTNVYSSQMKIFPTECRESGSSYKSKIQVTVQWKVDNEPQGSVTKVIAYVPMMVKSDNCSLARLSPEELVRHHEEAEEAGGYFIINGIEKIIRMLILPRRNYPLALVRSTWKNRGPLYTEYGIQMRSVRKDETAVNMVLHYLSDGSVTMAFGFQKELFYVPVVFILKALVNTTDQHIYKELIRGEEDNTFLKDCVATMLRTAQEEGATNQRKVLEYIGEKFRVKMRLPEWYSDEAVAQFLIQQCVCVHLEANLDKFNMLTFMTRKLYSLALGKCAPESADSPMMQEVLLGGHLYLMVLKEKLEQWLQIVASNLTKASKVKPRQFVVNSASVLAAIAHSSNITHQMEYLMATGNLISRSGLALLQVSGFTVVADRLNVFRFISHFRCVHRGAFFSQMRTTSVRKLLPEAWGFLCPVHTPDGAPCGLLNHLAAACEIVNVLAPVAHLHRLLCTLGMIPHDAPLPGDPKDYYPVVMDGRVLGNVDRDLAPSLENKLRVMKVLGQERVPPLIEVCLVPKTNVASQYPALFIFTKPARMMRPVIHLATGKVEMIGTFEQVYMDIAIIKDEIHQGITTHLEIKQTAMLSAVASMTPFSDFNQSPRNMYQCQMGKQTMGTPVQAFKHRTDNKLYRIQTPQSPLVRPTTHDEYCMDNYPLGTNAIVAVISYTGYDMEDAMILNKSSYERGFAHGSIYKAQFVDLKPKNEKQTSNLQFGCLPNDARTEGRLDSDGLPPIGSKLENGDPFYSYIDNTTGEATIKKYTNLEPCIIDDVKILGNEMGDKPLTKVCIKLRIQRNPIIGDKFSSRHGQKGICSQKWPAENMPFSESGMTPDIIFNPHGFPSRMTIGMMIESMAGKSASLNGHVYDATPFQFSEDDSAIDYFGKLLVKSGYDYFGTERLYSGIDGREFEADIFMGVVYYQRLRHMVADKFQVRTTGPIDILTHQPVQGRKKQGGIRFGEMERDALLAHGTSFLLQDRLMNCSDRTVGHVCSKCGSLLSSVLEKPTHTAGAAQGDRKWYCKSCNSSDNIQILAFPYVFRYLVAELAAMNIKTCLDVNSVGSTGS